MPRGIILFGAPYFVMSGSMWSIRKTFEPLFELAVFMVARVDGTKTIADNAKLVVDQYLAIISSHTVGGIS